MFLKLAEPKEISQVIPKLPYRAPILSIYGRVAELTQSGTVAGTENPGSNANKKPSSREMKENMSRVGTHPLGFGLYLFDYKAEFQVFAAHGRQFGVMIDEVIGVVPGAIGADEKGCPVVDYSMLGISFPVLH